MIARVWSITYTDEFWAWWIALDDDERASIMAGILQVEALGPALGRPFVDTLYGSKHGNLKELRTQHAGRPYRTFFAFDPQRTAVFLIGGDKTGDDRFYETMIPVADRLFDEYLARLGR